jgi:hypothetical protein
LYQKAKRELARIELKKGWLLNQPLFALSEIRQPIIVLRDEYGGRVAALRVTHKRVELLEHENIDSTDV